MIAPPLLVLSIRTGALWNREGNRRGPCSCSIPRSPAASSGAFQLQAAISALHAQAPDHAETGWREIVLLYEALHRAHAHPGVPAQPRRGAVLCRGRRRKRLPHSPF